MRATGRLVLLRAWFHENAICCIFVANKQDATSQHTKTFVDNYRTPHSEKLHVTERYKILPNGNTLEAFIKLDDPDAFNEPLYMIKRWRKAGNPFLETVCAENNVDYFYNNLVPIPTAAKPDF